MFVRYYMELHRPFPEVEAALLAAPQEWLPGLATEAQARGQGLLVEVGFETAGGRVGKQVEIELGDSFRTASKTILPMTWRATRTETLFPSLEADLEVAALGAGRTQFSISARYRPPFGAVGRAIDRTLLHRVAEATLKDFLDRAGEALLARVPTRSPA